MSREAEPKDETQKIEELLKPFSDILDERPALKKLLIEFAEKSEAHYAHFEHSVAVARLCGKVGKRFYEARNGESRDLILAGLLHDLGKKYIKEDILNNKNGQLTAREQGTLTQHPFYSLKILDDESIPINERTNDRVLYLIGSHHEVLKDSTNGDKGPLAGPYPREKRLIISPAEDKRMKKDSIMEELARVLAIVDRMQATARGQITDSDMSDRLISFIDKDTIDADAKKKLKEILEFIKNIIREDDERKNKKLNA